MNRAKLLFNTSFTYLLIIIVLLISGGIIGTQIKSTLSISELFGFSSEEYILEERFDYSDDIIDYFAEPDNYSAELYYELDRAQLREWNYPEPFLLYIGLILLVLSVSLVIKNIVKLKKKSFRIIIVCLFTLIFLYSMLIWSDPLSLFNQVVLKIRGYNL
ncbi:hypothetical protein KZ483_26940 [Paenibacillus sp. sptzw28]|uniref:hypothetical protein n=1 Tax=Paenibacillus sp. sptzw28 TaxID=715179 RepID=UPI001C6E75AC|nr:hypothetical protein [Paenibacillus sp. sptzw28]QYR21274.1 hypothetical protein KZ483_26940 [Paenibacillus sp. sptzw28]